MENISAGTVKRGFLNLQRLFFYSGLLGVVSLFFYGISQPMPISVSKLEGRAEFYSKKTRAWEPMQEGTVLASAERFRTTANSVLRARLSPAIALAFENRSLAAVSNSKYREPTKTHRVWISEGSFSAALKPGSSKLKIDMADAEAEAQAGTFKVVTDPRKMRASIYVLEGEVFVGHRANASQPWTRVGPHQKVEVTQGFLAAPKNFSEDDWRQAAPAYALYPIDPDFQRHQNRLSLRAGSLFKKVSLQGDFYTPGQSYFRREFVQDARSGETVLKNYYDVSVSGAFAGIYMMVPGFSFEQYQGIEFDIRSAETEGPAVIYLEFKSAGEVAFHQIIRQLSQEWEPRRINFPAGAGRRVDEVIFYVTYGSSGSAKRGEFFLRRLNLIEKGDRDAAA